MKMLGRRFIPKSVLGLVLFCLLSFNLKSQDTDFDSFKGRSISVGISVNIAESYFKEYGFAELEQFVTINPYEQYEFKGGPESVLFEILIAQNNQDLSNITNEDLNLNDYKNNFTIETVDSLKDKGDFLLLEHKLTFNKGGDNLSIIKYTQFIDSLEVESYTIQLRKQNNQWLIENDFEVADIEEIVKVVDADQFWSLVKSRPLNDDDYPIPEDLLSQVKNINGVLDLYKLSEYIKQNGWSF